MVARWQLQDGSALVEWQFWASWHAGADMRSPLTMEKVSEDKEHGE